MLDSGAGTRVDYTYLQRTSAPSTRVRVLSIKVCTHAASAYDDQLSSFRMLVWLFVVEQSSSYALQVAIW